MAQNGAVIVFCSSCKILYFASSVHPRIATDLCLMSLDIHWSVRNVMQNPPSIFEKLQ